MRTVAGDERNIGEGFDKNIVDSLKIVEGLDDFSVRVLEELGSQNHYWLDTGYGIGLDNGVLMRWKAAKSVP